MQQDTMVVTSARAKVPQAPQKPPTNLYSPSVSSLSSVLSLKRTKQPTVAAVQTTAKTSSVMVAALLWRYTPISELRAKMPPRARPAMAPEGS